MTEIFRIGFQYTSVDRDDPDYTDVTNSSNETYFLTIEEALEDAVRELGRFLTLHIYAIRDDVTPDKIEGGDGFTTWEEFLEHKAGDLKTEDDLLCFIHELNEVVNDTEHCYVESIQMRTGKCFLDKKYKIVEADTDPSRVADPEP